MGPSCYRRNKPKDGFSAKNNIWSAHLPHQHVLIAFRPGCELNGASMENRVKIEINLDISFVIFEIQRIMVSIKVTHSKCEFIHFNFFYDFINAWSTPNANKFTQKWIPFDFHFVIGLWLVFLAFILHAFDALWCDWKCNQPSRPGHADSNQIINPLKSGVGAKTTNDELFDCASLRAWQFPKCDETA